MSRKLISIVCVLALVSTGYGDPVDPGCDPNNCVVIGNWELQNDGWIDWGNKEYVDSPNNMPGKYNYSQYDVTLGEYSLHLNQAGWNQNLALQLHLHGLVDAFMDHTCFCIDVSVPPNTEPGGGWQEIYSLTVNADGFGWHDIGDKPKIQWGYWDGLPDYWRHATVCWDYSEVFDTINDPPSYLEIIITTNSDGVHNDFYFDNARLCIPEPTTIALLGLGGLALCRRKR